MALQSSNPVEVRYGTESDLSTFIEIELLSFASSKYLHNTYHDCNSPALQAFKTISSYEAFVKPETHTLAAVFPATGKIIAYSRWTIPTKYKLERGREALLSDAAQAKMRNKWDYAPPMNNMVYECYEDMVKQSRNVHLHPDDISTSPI